MQTRILFRSAALSFSVLPVLALAACGDGGGDGGWTTQVYSGAPYTYERTAGHGVEYVRANMLPPKAANTEPLMPKAAPPPAPVAAPVATTAEAPPPPVVAPPKTADKVFHNKQAK